MAKILVACEYSGTVRDAFTARGHDATSCDILDTESPGSHYTGDVQDILYDGWDLVIAHPPCTYLTCSAEWAYKERDEIKKNLDPNKLYGAERREARVKAAEFFMLFVDSAEFVAIENPVGVMSRIYRKPDQIIQPYEYGHDASKRTCLWLKNLPHLVPTIYVEPRWVDGKPRWSNQTDSGQSNLPPSKDRGHKRSATYQGWADAMAEQWSKIL